MRKAFLCHSSADKPFVEHTASLLGRAHVYFDKWHFSPGEDFRDSIRQSLDSTDLFVFFASSSSVSSTWCKFELDEADYRRLHGRLSSVIVIAIDQTTTHANIPEWMQRLLMAQARGPKQAAREIEHLLINTFDDSTRQSFIGRNDLAEDLVSELGSLNQIKRRILIGVGLEGIGRRAYLENAVVANLGLHYGPLYIGDETRDLTDLYLWLLDELEIEMDAVQLKNEIKEFSSLSQDQQAQEVGSRLSVLANDNTMPVLVDGGQFLDDTGQYTPNMKLVLSSFLSAGADCYLSLIHTRMPRLHDTTFAPMCYAQRIAELSDAETRVLLANLLRSKKIAVAASALNEISDFLGGYPPSAQFATACIRQYGADVVLADKSMLVDFKDRRFTKFLNDLVLSADEWLTLLYINGESLLPLDSISAALEIEPDKLAAILRKLIDLSLIVLTSDQKYRVSGPIRDSLTRSRGRLQASDYNEIQRRLIMRFWSQPNAVPSLEVVDATLHALASAGSCNADFGPYAAYVRPSTLFRLAKEAYYRQEWENCIDYARRCEHFGSLRREVRQLVFKALVQLERWPEAPGQLHVKPRKKRSKFVRGRPRPSRRGVVCRGCCL